MNDDETNVLELTQTTEEPPKPPLAIAHLTVELREPGEVRCSTDLSYPADPSQLSVANLELIYLEAMQFCHQCLNDLRHRDKSV